MRSADPSTALTEPPPGIGAANIMLPMRLLGKCEGSPRRAIQSDARTGALRLRVRPEDLDLPQLEPQALERQVHGRIVEVSLEIDEEHVLPELPLRGPRLDLGQVDRAIRELGEANQQRAGLVV